MSARILLVEDDPLITGTLTELLAGEGYTVDAVRTQAGAAKRLEGSGSSPYQLALLDVSLAEGSGFAVCALAKQTHPDLPVIFLTASDDEISTVTGLTIGADDYIAKPFRPRELLARIQAAIRRSRPARSHLLRLGAITIDPDSAHVERAGEEIALSALEYRLLLLFARHPGKLITREAIRDALWDEAGAYIEENTLSVYIRRLRNKIEDDPATPKIIETVRGLGYRARA